ncbi:MAG TPA: hypothetical protein VD931_06240 [Baekduia sp.]|nr:hypothetical protein [Baekduia sp.]
MSVREWWCRAGFPRCLARAQKPDQCSCPGYEPQRPTAAELNQAADEGIRLRREIEGRARKMTGARVDPRDCERGQLRRACNICELISERDAARAEVERLRAGLLEVVRERNVIVHVNDRLLDRWRALAHGKGPGR